MNDDWKTRLEQFIANIERTRQHVAKQRPVAAASLLAGHGDRQRRVT